MSVSVAAAAAAAAGATPIMEYLASEQTLRPCRVTTKMAPGREGQPARTTATLQKRILEGSLTLVSGAYGTRPAAGLIQAGFVNAALEGLTRGLALELAPIRVNCVSPGLVDTPLWAGMPAERREALFSHVAGRLPARRIGKPEDIALQILSCMINPFMTGAVITLDGGSVLA